MKISLTGDPVSQARVRFSSRGKFGHAYDPNEKIKKEIKERLKKLKGDDTYFYKNPRVSFVFKMAIPKSIPKKLRVKYLEKIVRHEKKPDIDNLVKLYMDCLTGIFYEDDSVVSLGESIKIYDPNPETLIIIEEKEPEINSWIDMSLPIQEELHVLKSCKSSFSEKVDHSDFLAPGLSTAKQYLDKIRYSLGDPSLIQLLPAPGR